MKVKLPTKKFYFQSETISGFEMFHKIIQFVSSFGRVIGAQLFSTDFTKLNPALIIVFVDFVTYLMISLQNIYMFRENFGRVVFCMVTLGMGFQGAIKLYTFIMNRPKILQLAKLAEGFYELSRTDRKKDEIFQSWSLIFCHVSILGLIIFYGCATLIFLFPLVFYLIFQEKILHFGFIIPGIDPKMILGYSLNFAHQTLQIYIVVNALFISSCYALYFMINAFAQFDSLQHELLFLENLIKNKTNEQNLKNCLARITGEHVKLLK